jgi:hypothetical protein
MCDDTIVWSPIGRFVHRIEPDITGLFEGKWDQAMMAEFVSPGLQQGLGWELQKSGWLKSDGLGALERFNMIIEHRKNGV